MDGRASVPSSPTRKTELDLSRTPPSTPTLVIPVATTESALEPTRSRLQRLTTRDGPPTSVFSHQPSATSSPKFSLLHETVFICVIVCAQLLTQSALAISIAPLRVIGHDLDATTEGDLSWLTASFSLTVGTFILPAGRWGDLFGHKRLFVVGYFWFGVWSLIAGFSVFATNLPFFAFCRAMQGIGPAVMLPNGIAVLARTYPEGRRREMVLSLFGATAPGGFVFGAVFSGIFATYVWWVWAYWVLGMVALVFAGAAMLVVPRLDDVHEGKVGVEKLDPVGTVVGVAGLVAFNFAWNQGPAAGWDKVYVYVMLIVGSVLLAAFLWYEIKIAQYPLLPAAAFSRDTSFVFGCLAAGWASFGIWVYYFWQFLLVLEGDSILLAAAKQVPTGISGAVAAIVTGLLISRIQPGWIMLISMTSFLVGTILLATNEVGETYWGQYFVASIVTCWGMDMSFPSGVIVLSNHMPKELQGVAASLVNTVINYSISIGLGLAGTVEVQVNQGGTDVLGGYRGAWYVGIGLDAVGVILALCLVVSWRATQQAKQKLANTKEVA